MNLDKYPKIGDMNIKTFEEKTYTLIVIYHLGALENSIHIICDHKTRRACVVDPAWDADLFIQITQKLNYKIDTIWLTHWHPDHTNATDDLANKTGAKVYAGEHEKPYLSDVKSPIIWLIDNQAITLGQTPAQVINTPGHTAGGICFLLDNRLIAADTLFIYGAGHCALPGANVYQLFQSMQRLKTLPDEIFVHCGHDYGCEIITTLAKQKQGNPFLLLDNESDFVRYRQEIHDNTRQYPMSAMTKTQVLALL